MLDPPDVRFAVPFPQDRITAGTSSTCCLIDMLGRSHIYVRHLMMTGNEFERRVRKLGTRRGVPVSIDLRHGKGSHVRLYYGERFTTLKDRKKEIGPGLFKAMLDQLGLNKGDFEAP
jgi:hypothetical protein